MTIQWPASTELRRPVKRTKRNGASKPRQAPERAIQVAIVKELRKHARCPWFAVPNGGYRHMHTAMKLKAEGVCPGVPDLVFVLPGGRFGGLELKAEKGRLSDDQKNWRAWISAQQGWWGVAHSVDEAWGILAAWGVLPSAVEGTT